jgi:hypothetical protein
MYKNNLKDGELDRFTGFEIAQMKAHCLARHANVEFLYRTAYDICM